MLLLCPPWGLPLPVKGTWDLPTAAAPGPALHAAVFCLHRLGCVKPLGSVLWSPPPNFSVLAVLLHWAFVYFFFLLIGWNWFYFFLNEAVCIFNCLFPTLRRCSFYGACNLFGTYQCKTSRAFLLLVHYPLTEARECQGFSVPSALLSLGERSPNPSRKQSRPVPERVHLREAWPWRCCKVPLQPGMLYPMARVQHQVIMGGTCTPSIRVDVRKDGGACVRARRVVRSRGQYAVRRLSRCA